ncbi:heptahelical transmembrane protein 2-like isoform X1 [Prunus avium]|uniref:Heptahelical transmembrane protein 2-like isoform X1 n=1 Tax=Prunus avium TaxID=42229 RepID=A0A6P5T5X4_PRUAV|nr:heptahelical transmembrane protein 2-like isoform X1 [Prunus avium]
MCNHGKREESETKTTKQQKVKSVKKKMTLMKFQDLPQYMKDNEFILDYYRCEWPLNDVVFSVFAWHNETLNIWTHLVGFLIFVGLTVMSLRDDTELGGLLGNFSRASVSGPLMTMTTMKMMDLNVSSTQNVQFPPPDSHLRQISQASSIIHANKENVYDAIPRWPWFVFLSGAMGCLVCSSLSHLLACHSKRFNFFFWRLDYAGISLMIVCSFFAPIYYCFSCNPYSRFFYLSSISVLGILAIITLLSPSLSAPRFRSFRATLFLSMGFSGVIPTVHALVLYWGNQHIFVALGYELAMAIFYASGAAFYVSRIPERWKPGKFDLAGHSHQIFHVFVVLGALAHSAATLVVMDFRRGSPTCGY